jgi:hypothetical protein
LISIADFKTLDLPKHGGGTRRVLSFIDPAKKQAFREAMGTDPLFERAPSMTSYHARAKTSAAVVCLDIADCYNGLCFDFSRLWIARSFRTLIKFKGPHDQAPDSPLSQRNSDLLASFMLPFPDLPGCLWAPAGLPSSPHFAGAVLRGFLDEKNLEGQDRGNTWVGTWAKGLSRHLVTGGTPPNWPVLICADNLFSFARKFQAGYISVHAPPPPCLPVRR